MSVQENPISRILQDVQNAIGETLYLYESFSFNVQLITMLILLSVMVIILVKTHSIKKILAECIVAFVNYCREQGILIISIPA